MWSSSTIGKESNDLIFFKGYSYFKSKRAIGKPSICLGALKYIM